MRYCYLPLVCLLLSLQLAHSQQPQVHKKKIYLDKNQRLYVQDSLPVYMFLSTSPDAKEAVQLKSEKTPKYVNPMHFDGHGKHNLVHKDYDHEVEITFEVYSDAYAPEAHISLSKAATFTKEGKLYCGKGLEVSLSSSDEMSGVEGIWISINGAEFTGYDKTIIPDKEQEYAVKYYAVDNVGNVSKVNTRSFVLDLTSPVTSMEVHGDKKEDILSPHATLVLKGEDALSGLSRIVYAIDAGSEMSYTAPVSLAYLSEGEHALKYYGIDHLGNKESVKEYKFYVDRSAPLVMEDVIGDRFVSNGREYSSGRTKVKLTAIDNKSGVRNIYYSINGGEYQEYKEPFDLPSKIGTVAIRSYAIDNVMNKSMHNDESNARIRTSYVDLSGPILHYAFQGPLFKTRDTVFISGKTSISLKGTDTESGMNRIVYDLDKKGEKEYQDHFVISEEGTHQVSYSGYDHVNNSSSDQFYFNLDNTGPEIFLHFSILPIGNNGKMDIYPSHVVLFPSATDALVGYDKMFYSVNGSPEKIYTGVIEGFHKNQTYTVKVRAIDKLGNENRKEITFKTEAQKISSIKEGSNQ